MTTYYGRGMDRAVGWGAKHVEVGETASPRFGLTLLLNFELSFRTEAVTGEGSPAIHFRATLENCSPEWEKFSVH